MKYEKLVSIIIPVYNTKKYLPECVDSLVSQTYKNIEIILVNDGSTDDSLELCNEYAKKDSRVKVVDKENAGAALARKAGFDVCSGEYVLFVDSDDYATPDCVETHLENFYNTNCDMSLSSYFVAYDKEKVKKIFNYAIYHSAEEIKKNFIFPQVYCLGTDKHQYQNFLWNRMYKRALITEDFFYSDREYCMEDLLFNFEYLKKCNTISVTSKPTYYYRQLSTSITNSYRKNQIYIENNLIKKLEEFTNYYCIDNPMRLIGAKYNSFRRCVENAFKLGNYKDFKNEIEDEWKEKAGSFNDLDVSKWDKSNLVFINMYKKNRMHSLYMYLKLKQIRRNYLEKKKK